MPKKSPNIGCTEIVHDEIEDLTKKANSQMERIAGLSRKLAVEVFRAGAILAQIRDLLKNHGGWCEFQGRQHWNRGTIAHYIRFYVAAQTEEAVAGMTASEAVEKLFNIPKEKTESKSKQMQAKGAVAEVESPLPVNIIGEAHDYVGQAISSLTLLTGERSVDKTEIKKLKATVERLIAIITELEGR